MNEDLKHLYYNTVKYTFALSNKLNLGIKSNYYYVGTSDEKDLKMFIMLVSTCQRVSYGHSKQILSLTDIKNRFDLCFKYEILC